MSRRSGSLPRRSCRFGIGDDCIPFAVDLSNLDGVMKLVDYLTEQEPNGIDFLINNEYSINNI